MTELKIFSCTRGRVSNINAKKLASSTGSHDYLRVFSLGQMMTCSTFITLKNSKWWSNLTQFNMEFEEKDYTKFSTQPELKAALLELGSSGQLTHFGLGCRMAAFDCDAVFDFLRSKRLRKVKSLTLYDNYPLCRFKEIVYARRSGLEELRVQNVNYQNFTPGIPKIPNLKILEIEQQLLSLNSLAELRKLERLKIGTFYHSISEKDCWIPAKSLPNVTYLDIGSALYPYNQKSLICHQNLVSHKHTSQA